MIIGLKSLNSKDSKWEICCTLNRPSRFNELSKFAEAVTFLTCIQEVLSSNHSWDTSYLDRVPPPPSKCRHDTSNYATTTSFHVLSGLILTLKTLIYKGTNGMKLLVTEFIT
jgi:hypothetical protein